MNLGNIIVTNVKVKVKRGQTAEEAAADVLMYANKMIQGGALVAIFNDIGTKLGDACSNKGVLYQVLVGGGIVDKKIAVSIKVACALYLTGMVIIYDKDEEIHADRFWFIIGDDFKVERILESVRKAIADVPMP